VTTAYVLSGGGSLGAVQVGMLQALSVRKMPPDLLVGTSAGALNAAFLAGHGVDERALQALAQSWMSVRRSTIFPIQPWRQLRAVSGSAKSLCTNRGLSRLIESHLLFDRLERARIPVHIVATNLLSGEEELLSHGDALSAVLASTAIPGVFTPVRRDGLILVDGGLADNAAISQAIALGADRVVVLPTGYACALTEAPRRSIGIALQSLGLLIQQRLIRDVALYRDRAEIIVVPPLCPLQVSPVDFGRAGELIERARMDTAAWLERGNLSPVHPEQVLALHDHTRRGAGPTRRV